MKGLMIIIFSILCSSARASPITTDARFRHLVSQSPEALQQKRAVRDVFPDSTDRVPFQVDEAEKNKKKSDNDTERNLPNDQEVTTDKKEILQPVFYDSMALYTLLRRSRRDHNAYHRYADNNQNYYFDDPDYAGYDKKGSSVGYMEDNDDFPTVVW